MEGRNMNEIVFVTHNKGKIAEAQKVLKNIKLEIFEHELEEPRSEDVKYISKCKVMEAYKIVKKPCISMDAGFWIDELNGFPKAFVNFSLETVGINGILKLMEGKDNSFICDYLAISINTLKKHILNIYRKLGIRNRVQLFKKIREKE